MNDVLLILKALRTEIRAEHGVVVPVDGVDLHVRQGETVAIVGESGSGKSVTALSIARLLPDNARIAAGSVVLDRTDLADLPERVMRSVRGGRVSMIFQEPATSLNPVMPIGQQIVEAIEAHTDLRGQSAQAKAIDWLKRVGIAEPERRMASYPFELSGGQKQRVMIAIALAAEPEVLIADEPTTALDVTVQKQILELLKDLQRERGMAMVLITHDLGVVAQFADHIALMYAGQIVEVASAKAFFARPLHPYARQLLNALPDIRQRGQSLSAIVGSVPALDQPFDECRFASRCHSVAPRCRAEPPPAYAVDDQRRVRCFGYAPENPVALKPLTPAVDVQTRVAALPKSMDVTHTRPPALSVENLRVSFPIRAGLLRRTVGYVTPVDGVWFSIAPGQTLALVGESGCGKTTVAKAVLQLLRGRARIEGRTMLHGRDLIRARSDELREARRRIQVVFQDPLASLNPRMRVGDILAEGLQSLRPDISRADRLPRLRRLLDQVGLAATALDKYPHEFSGGQRQRIAIARALAVEPEVIVCDEPTSALDVSVQAQVLNLLRQLQQQLGVSYLFITHNLGVVGYLADRIAVMRSGRIVEQGIAAGVLERPEHEYTRTLLDAVPPFPVEIT
ncbi:MAG TPA: dipeptide ABC transporter ATP-binding protein [Burkholderiaceae bacterium]|nr:dipeptide ABC transporter ATP-binding protein [Burkholderiaceae bacterium]